MAFKYESAHEWLEKEGDASMFWQSIEKHINADQNTGMTDYICKRD